MIGGSSVVRTDVVVVGAGPVGLVAALGLAREGLAVTLLEARASTGRGPHDLVYRWSVLPLLEQLGVLPALVEVGIVSTRWAYQVLRTGEQLVFDLDLLAEEVAHPFNLHLSHDVFSEVLLARLAEHPNVVVERGARVSAVTQDDDAVTVWWDGADGPHAVHAGWAIGTDGVHSAVRRSLGLGFGGLTWGHRLVSLSLPFDFSSLGYLPTTYQLDPDHSALVAQVETGELWRYVYSESRSLPEDTVADRIPDALRAVLPRDTEARPDSWSAYRVHERTADRLRAGRVLLAGDAAHVTNPSGSFGLAGGLTDAVAAVRAVRTVVHDRARDAELDRYAEDRETFFRTVASPLSSDTMHLVFHSSDHARLESEIQHYRQILGDPDRQREYLLLSRDLEGLPVV